MKHYIITNRKILNKGTDNECISREGNELASDNIRFAEYDSEKDNVILYKDIEESKSDYSEVKSDNLLKSKEGSKSFFANIYNDMLGDNSDIGNDSLVYIHGYDNSFDNTLKLIKQLEEIYIKNDSPIKRIIMISWPSNGAKLEYRDDQRDAEVTGYTIGRHYLKLAKFLELFFQKNGDERLNQPCNSYIHLMCHSMGNFVFQNMVQMLLTSSPKINSLFKEIILTGADVDWNALEIPKPLSNITMFCDRVHIYFNKNDKALMLSETVKNSQNRLGKYGPQNKINLHNAYVVDVSELADDFFASNHSYHYDNDEVIKDIINVFKGERVDRIINRKLIDGFYYLENIK